MINLSIKTGSWKRLKRALEKSNVEKVNDTHTAGVIWGLPIVEDVGMPRGLAALVNGDGKVIKVFKI